MLVEDIIDDDEEKLQFNDHPTNLTLNYNDEEPKYLYRVVSQEELDSIRTNGVIKPSEFYQRVHASAIPEAVYGKGKVLKIKYDTMDEWKPKLASVGVYATTWNDVSEEKIVDTYPVSALPNIEEMSLEEQYEYFQT